MQSTQINYAPDDQTRVSESFRKIRYYLETEELSKAIAELLTLHYAELADFLDNTDHHTYTLLLPQIQDSFNPETLVCLSDSNKQQAIHALGFETSAKFIEELDLEDAIEVIEEVDKETRQSLLDIIGTKRKQQILEGFNYPENTAGRVLEKDFIALQEHWSTGQAIDYIRRCKYQNDFYAAIVVNSKFKPIGIIQVSALLQSTRDKPINSLMNDDFKICDPFTQLDDLAFTFKQYALTIVPVINKSGKLIGSISIDNMVYIIEQQTESELIHLSGVQSTDIYQNLHAAVLHRFPWLFVNLITACATSLIIDHFNETILHLVALATVMPIVAAIGGNAGAQVMTVTVRALANREITSANMNKIVAKEVLISFTNGCFIALLAGIISFLFFGNANLSMIFASSIIINLIIAGAAGTCIPIILHSMDIDPATASTVFVSGFTDAVGYFSLLGLAYLVLM